MDGPSIVYTNFAKVSLLWLKRTQLILVLCDLQEFLSYLSQENFLLQEVILSCPHEICPGTHRLLLRQDSRDLLCKYLNFFCLQNSLFSRIPSLKFWLLQPLQTQISVFSIQFHFSGGNCLQLEIIGFSHLSSFKNHKPWLLLGFV